VADARGTVAKYEKLNRKQGELLEVERSKNRNLEKLLEAEKAKNRKLESWISKKEHEEEKRASKEGSP